MSTRRHLHYTKPGLVIQVVRDWPKCFIRDDQGRTFDFLEDAVAEVLKQPGDFVPVGCPTPGPDGRCPGHPCESDPGEEPRG